MLKDTKLRHDKVKISKYNVFTNGTAQLIADRFVEFNSWLKDAQPKGRQLYYNFTGKILAIAKAISVPQPFKPFVEIAEKRLNFKFPETWKFTNEEVLLSDQQQLNAYSKPDFDYQHLDFTLLIYSAVEAARSLGFFDVDAELMSIKDSVDSFPSSSNAGYPTFLKKGNPIAKEDALAFAQRVFSNGRGSKDDFFNQPTVLFHRFQYKFKLNEPDTINKKARQIWGSPFRINAIEGVFYRDLVNKVADP